MPLRDRLRGNRSAAHRATGRAAPQANPYRVWIAEYAGAPYQEVAAKARAHLDSLADRYATPAREAELTAIFREATRLETEFWEMGWRKARVVEPRLRTARPRAMRRTRQRLAAHLGFESISLATRLVRQIGDQECVSSGSLAHRSWGFNGIFSIPRLEQEGIQVRLPPMPILIITEKTSQARDLRAALGDRFRADPAGRGTPAAIGRAP